MYDKYKYTLGRSIGREREREGKKKTHKSITTHIVGANISQTTENHGTFYHALFITSWWFQPI